MSQPLQSLAIPADALHRAPSRFVITSTAGVSLEQLLRDVNLPKDLETVIDVQFNTEGPGYTRFVVTCPDYWVWNKVLLHVSLLGQQYDVYLDKTMTYSAELVAGGSGDGVATPTLESRSRRSTISTFSNGSGFSPWESVNPPESPLREVQKSPLFDPRHKATPDSYSMLSGADPRLPVPAPNFRDQTALANGTMTPVKIPTSLPLQKETKYAEEWPWSAENGDMKGKNVDGDAETCSSEGSIIVATCNRFELTSSVIGDVSRKQGSRSSSFGYSNEDEEESSAADQKPEGTEMDLDTTEDDRADDDDEDPLPSGYEADRSEADSDHDLHRVHQQPPSPWVVTSANKSGRRYKQASVAISASSPRTDTRITESEPAADDAGTSSTTEASTSNALPEPENDNPSNDLPEEEAAEINDLIQAMSAMAATLPDYDGTADPEVAPNGQPEEGSPNTSAESAELLGAIRGEFNATLGVSPSAMMGPDVHESVEDQQD